MNDRGWCKMLGCGDKKKSRSMIHSAIGDWPRKGQKGFVGGNTEGTAKQGPDGTHNAMSDRTQAKA